MRWLGGLLGGLALAQTWITGIILDDASGEPLPFVTVRNLRTGQGTYTDLQGRFRIEAQPADTLEMRCVGYEMQRLPASLTAGPIRLTEKPVEVSPVVIRPGENPAHALIRRLQAARSRWDPLRRPHKYLSYNKLTLGLAEIPDSLREDSIPAYLFLWETETEKQYYSPVRQTERLKAQRVVGNLPVQSILSPTTFLPMSFYDERITLGEVQVISPVGTSALSFYEYAIQDTLYAGPDTLIQIEFFPRRGREAWTLRGMLTIALPDAALYAFQGETVRLPTQNRFLQITTYRIWHYYEKLGDTLWFPMQLHSEVTFRMRSGEAAAIPFLLRSRSFLWQVEELPVEERPQRPEVILPGTLPPITYRAEPLSLEESRSYQFMDSLMARLPVKRLRWLFDLPTLITGRLPLGRFNLILRPFLLYHDAEGLRPQLGIETSDRFSETFRVRTWLGYGTYRWAGARGTPWRYGGEIEIGRLHRAGLFYYDDVRENTLPRLLDENPAFLPGEQRIYENAVRGYGFRWEDMLRERATGLSLRTAIRGHLTAYLSGSAVERTTASTLWRGLRTVVGLEYMHRHSLLRRGGTVWRAEYALPRIHLQGGVLWTEGSALRQLPFWIQADLLHRWQWGRWAQMRLRLSGTYTATVPQPWLPQLRTLPDINLGMADALAAHPGRYFVRSVLYAFYEWSLPNTRFPSRNWNPVLTFHLQGAYADERLYPEAGLSLQNWVPPRLTRLLSSLELTRIGVFTPLSGRFPRERFYLRLSTQVF